MVIVMFSIPLIFFILGILLKFGKGSFLIAGYNTASKEEKEEYDEKALCNCMGNLMLFIAGIILLAVVAEVFNLVYLTQIRNTMPVLIIVAVIGTIIYMNTGNRFKRE